MAELLWVRDGRRLLGRECKTVIVPMANGVQSDFANGQSPRSLSVPLFLALSGLSIDDMESDKPPANGLSRKQPISKFCLDCGERGQSRDRTQQGLMVKT